MATVPKEPGEDLNCYESRLRRLFESREVPAEDFFENTKRECTSLYLSRDNPRGQSGHGSDVYRWRNVRWMLLEPIYHSGAFIDVGCASGHLIESLAAWMQNTDVQIEFHGVDISPGLCDLAKTRLPEIANRIYCANAVDWVPCRKFEYVYTMILPDLPSALARKLMDNLYENYLNQGGRIILGPWRKEAGLETEIEKMGFEISGYCEKSVPGWSGEIRRIIWIDK